MSLLNLTDEDSPQIVLIASQEWEGQRLDKFLPAQFPEFPSRTYFQSLIEKECVKLNDLIVKKRTLLKTGDRITVEFIVTDELELSAENIPFEIVYEDTDYIVINKQAGLVVHPAPGNWNGTLVNGLIYYLKGYETAFSNDPKTALRPGIIHRLDKDTSGLIIAAKNPFAKQKLCEEFAKRTVKKEYTAITLGNPGTQVIKGLIGRDPLNRQRMAVVPEKGKIAETHIHTLCCSSLFGFVHVNLMTGRTHQIRVHLKSLNCPILGDFLYGNNPTNEKYKVKRQLLHARKLSFIHPFTGKEISLFGKFPDDFKHFIEHNLPNAKNFLVD